MASSPVRLEEALVALQTMRDAMRLDATCGLVDVEDTARYDVSSLTEPLPESQLEDAIRRALDDDDDNAVMPKRDDLAAALLRRGTTLRTLKLDEHLKSGQKKRYDVRDKNCPAVKRTKGGAEDLVVRFSVLSQGTAVATFELAARRDTLDTLAELFEAFTRHATVAAVGTDGTFVFRDGPCPPRDPRRSRPLADLRFGLHSVFAFEHGANCRHVLALTSAKLSNDPRPPALVFLRHDVFQARSHKCDVCDAFTARTAVFDDPRVTDTANPALFCDQCLHMFYYTADGFLHPDTTHLLETGPTRFFPLYERGR